MHLPGFWCLSVCAEATPGLMNSMLDTLPIELCSFDLIIFYLVILLSARYMIVLEASSPTTYWQGWFSLNSSIWPIGPYIALTGISIYLLSLASVRVSQISLPEAFSSIISLLSSDGLWDPNVAVAASFSRLSLSQTLIDIRPLYLNSSSFFSDSSCSIFYFIVFKSSLRFETSSLFNCLVKRICSYSRWFLICNSLSCTLEPWSTDASDMTIEEC